MLERASSCLEPAAQNLFRSIEAPTRSQRRLPQAFWRHARIAQEHASWWPAYLDDIRKATQAREGGSDGSISVRRVAPAALPFAPQQWILPENATTYSKQTTHPTNRRNISKIVKQSRARDHKAFEEALELEEEHPTPAEVTLFAPEGIPEVRRPRLEMTTAERLEELLRAGGEPKFNAVWLAFISLKEQAGFARAVLRYLSRCPLPVVLRRALRTFEMIEIEDRTHLTYESAVRAAIGLRKYGTANDFVLEALQRGLGVESSQFLMGHLIEKEMWKSAFQTLHVFLKHTRFKPDNQSTTNQDVLQHMREGPVWRTVDEMLSLPRKLIALCARLKEGDAVLALDKGDMEYLATRLLERTLRSTTIMGAITAEGLLGLFDSYRDLGLLRFRHYLDALSALRALRDSRNRSQLALLIFRNMRWQYPTVRVKDSTYGTMISILSAYPNEPKAFEYILKDVTHAYKSPLSGRKRDMAMYQRVMSACADQGHTSYVQHLLQNLLRDHGDLKDLAYFTPLLLSSAKRGDVEATKRSFDELSSKYGLMPDHRCWNILLLAYAKAEDFEGAAALFAQMRNIGVFADSYTFGTLMSMYSNAGDTQAVLQLVDMARRQKIPATTAMIDTIVHSYCMNDEVKEAESLVEAATQMSLSGSPTRMWNILLRHYAFRGDSASVLKIQERMRELAVRPDGMTYAALMTSLVVVGKTKDAAAILRSLHFGQIVTASQFHYSIVFHGYVLEGQRDEAMVIYTEMLQRFPRPSPSARLAMLHLQSQRDELQARRQEAAAATHWTGHNTRSASPLQSRAIDFLADALLEMADFEALSKEPQPGFRRRRPTFAAPGIYLEVPVNVLCLSSSYYKAGKLISRYKSLMDASNMSKQQKSFQTVQLLTAHLRGVIKAYETSGRSTSHLRQQSRNRVDLIWSQILEQTISTARERNLSLLNAVEIKLLPNAVLDHGEVSSADTGVSKNRLRSEPFSPPDTQVTIIPAKRFALSAPLSVYMRGLVLQRRFPALESLLQHVQDLGFELTSKNWNTYIQLLTHRRDTTLQAFCTFEQKLLPNTPPWELLKRGKVLSLNPEQYSSADGGTAEARDTVLSRSTMEKRQPGRLMPTYFTVIHLAAALLRAYRTRPEDSKEKTLYNELQKQAPGTVKYVQAMPHLKDRVQGVLLRGRAVKGDPMRRTREAQPVDRAGLLGSRSLLDEVSPEDLDDLEKFEKTEEELRSVVEKINGPIIHDKLITARRGLPESPEVHDQRLLSQKRKQNLVMKQLQTQAADKAAHAIATSTDGEPYFDGLPVQEDVAELAAFKTQQQTTFREHVENLRTLAKQPEPIPPRWRIRSTRRRQQSLRIIAYPSRSSQQQLLKPMSNFVHKDPVFTKPMLTMQIPRRRKLGSERRAYDLPKKYMELKKQREREMRKAQARVRKTKRRDQALRLKAGMVDDSHDGAFLEQRLVHGEARDQDAASATDYANRSQANVARPGSERDEQLSSKTAGTHPDEYSVLEPGSPQSPEKCTDHEPDQTRQPFVPWSQFDAEDFVNPQDASKDR